MSRHIWAVLSASAFCLLVNLLPANAGSSRLASFTMVCDGSQKTVPFNVSGFPASSSQFILGGGLDIYANNGTIKYLQLSAPTGNINSKVVLVLGQNENNARISLPTFYQVAANVSGIIPLRVVGVCTGSALIRGFALLYFN